MVAQNSAADYRPRFQKGRSAGKRGANEEQLASELNDLPIHVRELAADGEFSEPDDCGIRPRETGTNL